MDDLNKNRADVSNNPLNRAYDVDLNIAGSQDTTEQFLTVSLETIDSAIMYYFVNVINPQVVENGAIVKVPIMYGSQERWKSVRKDGFMRDNKGKLLTPLIMYKRNSVARDANIPIDKLDANNPQLYYTVQKKYSQKNRYDNFNILTDQAPVREFYNVVVPDYIIATYDVVLWTSYTKQMNTLVESMVFASDSYWGDSKKWRFRTQVSDIATPVEITTEEDRNVRGTFTLTVNGYLVPNTVNKILAQAGNQVKKTLSIKKVLMFVETDNIPAGFMSVSAGKAKEQNRISLSTTPPIIATVATPPNLNQLLSYLNKQFVKTADSASIGTAVYNSTTIAAPPSNYPQTQTVQENFMFFVNGQYIEHSAIVSFLQVGANAVLTVDTSLLGFVLDSDDEVVAVGKFDS